MRTNTEKYEASHGRKPKGNGLWMFELFATDGDGSYLTETVEAYGSLPEARKNAVAQLKRNCGRVKSVVEVTVLP